MNTQFRIVIAIPLRLGVLKFEVPSTLAFLCSDDCLPLKIRFSAFLQRRIVDACSTPLRFSLVTLSMPLFQVRELLQFPENGDNATDTVINNIHFNLTALNYFNYTLYSNGTLSNGSNCWLSFDMYQPSMLSNGTFINATSCYFPINGLEARGSVGIAFASMFGATVVFTLINLRKHGKTFLPLEKRWRAVGRRWQWYWMLFVAACGMISCFMSIDVDRSYLQGIALSLQSLFYYLLLPGLLAAVWEGVRHWYVFHSSLCAEKFYFCVYTQGLIAAIDVM